MELVDGKRSIGENYLDELVSPRDANVEYVSAFGPKLNQGKVDIEGVLASLVAVHGLNPGWKKSHGEGTWTKNDVLWLRDPDYLPRASPNARILLFGYNSKVAFDTTIAGVMDVARDLLNRLKSARRVRRNKKA